MAASMIDLTQQPHKVEFSGSSEENMAYAKTFWQSVQLHPPMESRLVSSDIRQRLKVAPPGCQGVNRSHTAPKEDSTALQAFVIRAKTIEKMEEVQRLNKLSQSREEDLRRLQRQRQDRIKKDLGSRERQMRSAPASLSQTRDNMIYSETLQAVQEIQLLETPDSS